MAGLSEEGAGQADTEEVRNTATPNHELGPNNHSATTNHELGPNNIQPHPTTNVSQTTFSHTQPQIAPKQHSATPNHELGPNNIQPYPTTNCAQTTFSQGFVVS